MGQRFEDTPGLFGYGAGTSTSRPITCDLCGKFYPGDPTDQDSVRFCMFADRQVAECCFDRIEREVLHRMPDILPWYARRVAADLRLSRKRREDLRQFIKHERGLATEILRNLNPRHKKGVSR